MSVVINGTTGITSVNGSAAAPSVTGADTDTGIVYGTNTLSLATGGTTAVTVDSSQNVGIGTSTQPSESQARMTLATSSSTYLQLARTATTVGGALIGTTGQNFVIQTYTGAVGSESYTERARITSAGEFLVGLTTYISGQSGSTLQATTSANNQTAVIQNTHASSPYGLLVMYPSAAPNNGSNEFLYCKDSSTTRAYIRSNGGLSNYSANNTNLSDERTKTDIVDAGSYLAKICAIPVRTFKYKDQTDDLLNLGVIAQEVEAVAPELVDVSGFGETPEDGVPLKSIYQTDLQYALMKCIQELKAELDAAKADIAALKAPQ